MKNIVIKIGTDGLPQDEILYLMPEFSAPSNYKDAEKIQAWKAKKQEEWLLDAPMSALSGRVLAVAYQPDGDDCHVIAADSEAEILEKFWEVFRRNPDCNFVGFNARNFDIPYLVRRSWWNKVIIPKIMQGRFLNWKFTDLAQIWACGCADKVSLNTLVKFFGIKGDTIDGMSFSAMWKVCPTGALRYLMYEVALTRAVGEAMGVIEEEVF